MIKSTKAHLLSLLSTRAAQVQVVIQTHCPTLRVESVRVPRLALNASGDIVETDEILDVEIVVRDPKWFHSVTREELLAAYAQAEKIIASRSPALPDGSVLRRLVYLEDTQMYSVVPYIFETDCMWSVDELAKLSWSIAQTASTSFESFQALLFCCGFKCNLIDRLDENECAPSGLAQVEGARISL